MTPNDLPYLYPLQSAYSLLIIGLVLFGNARNSQKIRLLPMVKWIATYAYRSYLANVFIFQVVLKLVHRFNQSTSQLGYSCVVYGYICWLIWVNGCNRAFFQKHI